MFAYSESLLYFCQRQTETPFIMAKNVGFKKHLLNS